MANNAIISTNSTAPAQLVASRLPTKIPAAEQEAAPVKKDTLELSDAALRLKAANAARTTKMDAVVKSAKALAILQTQKALQAAKELVASNAKKSSQEDTAEPASEKTQEKGAL